VKIEGKILVMPQFHQSRFKPFPNFRISRTFLHKELAMLRLTITHSYFHRRLSSRLGTVAVWILLLLVAKISCVSLLTPLVSELRGYFDTAGATLSVSGLFALAASALSAPIEQRLLRAFSWNRRVLRGYRPMRSCNGTTGQDRAECRTWST